MLLRVSFVVSLLAVLSACSDLDNSTPPAELIDFKPSIQLKTNWDLQLAGGTELYHKLTPVIFDDFIYTVSGQGFISKVNIQTGDIVWQKSTAIRTYAGLAVSENSIVLTSREGIVFVYGNSENLPLKWTKKISSEINAQAVISDGNLYIRSSNGELGSYQLSSGKENWVVKQRVPSLSITGTASPEIYDNYVLSGFDNGVFVVLDKKSGEEIWKKTLSVAKGRSELDRMVDADGQAAIQDGVIYVSNFQGRLMALSLHSGEELWSRPLSSIKALSFDKDALYVTDHNSMIWSIDRRNGTVLWKQDELHHRYLTAMGVENDAVVTTDFEGIAHWLDKTTGRLIARLAIGEEKFLNKPIVYKDSLLFLDAANNLSSISRRH